MNVPVRLALLSVACAAVASAALPPQQIFDQVRAHVARQIERTTKYTCVETIERSVYFEYFARRRSNGCNKNAEPGPAKLFSRDRLRLDVAVSQGNEIFSWRGVAAFSTKGVTDVVHSGPISSGSFIGYLENVFFHTGVKIQYVALPELAGRFYFTYDVPLNASAHYVSAGSAQQLTPFHGEFAADAKTFDLLSLSVIIDNPPRRTELCGATVRVQYQTADILGASSRVPKGFTLEIKDRNGISTTSRSTYQACRAFTGESTISYSGEADAEAPVEEHAAPKVLPPGIRLVIALQTAVGDRHSFTGDPVEGVVMRTVAYSKGRSIIPRGARVSGVITRLENRFEPSLHHLLGIRFDRLIFGDKTFLMEALTDEANYSRQQMRFIYSNKHAFDLGEDTVDRLLIFLDPHFELNSQSTHEWVTRKLSAAN